MWFYQGEMGYVLLYFTKSSYVYHKMYKFKPWEARRCGSIDLWNRIDESNKTDTIEYNYFIKLALQNEEVDKAMAGF